MAHGPWILPSADGPFTSAEGYPTHESLGPSPTDLTHKSVIPRGRLNAAESWFQTVIQGFGFEVSDRTKVQRFLPPIPCWLGLIFPTLAPLPGSPSPELVQIFVIYPRRLPVDNN